jgi:hypothetical protein
MLQWIYNNYYETNLDTAQKNFLTWEQWQNKQPGAHFVDSTLSSYIPIKTGLNNIYMKYCFGCFSNIIYTQDQCDMIGYFTMLINIYDQCKGYGRTFKGDSSGISLLRKIILDKNADDLYNHDFQCYNYNYTILHGHTVGYFSLSTLLLFFVSNYMYAKSYNNDYFPHIDMDECKKVYNKKVFGDITYITPIPKSLSMNIKKNYDKTKPAACSWPSIINNVNNPSKCSHCDRVCENLWGKLQHCLDCHLYVVCRECGGQKFGVGSDGYPRCALHQNL